MKNTIRKYDMKILNIMIVIMMMFILVGLITNIESIYISSVDGIIFKQYDCIVDKILNAIIFVLCAVWLYLIKTKHFLAWWLGTILFLVAIGEILYTMILSIFTQNASQIIFNVIGNLLLLIVIYIIFIRWWLREKRNFSRKEEE